MKNRSISLGMCFVACAAVWSVAQVGSNPPIPPSWTQRPGQSPTPNVKSNGTSGDPVDKMRDEELRRMGAKRQIEAREEAARLLVLATELKDQLEASGSGTVPAKAGPDADEIAKLAKSIRAKLRPL